MPGVQIMPPPTPSSGRRGPASNRNRTLAALGGALALGGLAWYAFSAWNGAESTGGGGGGRGGQAQGSSSRPSVSAKSAALKKNGPKPTLSLALPPTFIRTSASVRLLKVLLGALSQQYTITLLVPSTNVRSEHANGQAQGAGGAMETVRQLSETLSSVEAFDARRVLEYSKEEGRLALARALACDAHCEVMLQPLEDENAAQQDDEGDDDDDDDVLFGNDEEDVQTEDGDRTPRAASPSPGMHRAMPTISSTLQTPTKTLLRQGEKPDEALITSLETYHAEVARIRKSSGLLIFLLLPIAQRCVKRAKSGDMWSLGVEDVLKPFLMPGQRDLSARVPGVKVIDERILPAPSTPSKQPTAKVPSMSPAQKAWTEAAQRIGQFAHGWS